MNGSVITQFEACLAFTLGEEGGFTNDPRDPGGATNMGITLATLSNWRGDNCVPGDVRDLARNEAAAIYHGLYWQALQCGGLPMGVDLQIFDFGVNAGTGRAARMLQAALDVTVDGLIGPVTVGAAQYVDAVLLVGRLSDREEAYYRTLPTFSIFGVGWLSRSERRRVRALSMVALSTTT